MNIVSTLGLKQIHSDFSLQLIEYCLLVYPQNNNGHVNLLR